MKGVSSDFANRRGAGVLDGLAGVGIAGTSTRLFLFSLLLFLLAVAVTFPAAGGFEGLRDGKVGVGATRGGLCGWTT